MSIPVSVLEGYLLVKEGLTEEAKAEVEHAIKLLKSFDASIQSSREANVKSISLVTTHTFIKGELQPDWNIGITVNPEKAVDSVVVKNEGLLNFIKKASEIDAPIQRGVIHGKVE